MPSSKSTSSIQDFVHTLQRERHQQKKRGRERLRPNDAAVADGPSGSVVTTKSKKDFILLNDREESKKKNERHCAPKRSKMHVSNLPFANCRDRTREVAAPSKQHDPSYEPIPALLNHGSLGSSSNKEARPRHFQLPFDHTYICAPMVGASELPFRLLCRNYGTQLAYTPMMSASLFVHDLSYRATHFTTCEHDRPLVCHFAANTVDDFCAAARAAAPYCDAIDLNLGCPQRTAYVGHFGSYLLDECDRSLICNMVRGAATDPTVHGLPIFVKIRLLHTFDETLELCQQLAAAGVSLIAIHARQRASWERTGPGARDGPAQLDQVARLRAALHADADYQHVHVVTNGNTITYEDVVNNLKSTQAHGIMSAEGLLDNPALFLPRLIDTSTNNGANEAFEVVRVEKQTTSSAETACAIVATNSTDSDTDDNRQRKRRKYERKLAKLATDATIHMDDRRKRQNKYEAALRKLDARCKVPVKASYAHENSEAACTTTVTAQQVTVSLADLQRRAADPLLLAQEYVDLVRAYPTQLRSVIFHVRRMCKRQLTQYQLLEDCLAASSVNDVHHVLDKLLAYQADPASFEYDVAKAAAEKEALERKKREEGRRRVYEERMIRKAKRAGLPPDYYLNLGAELPTRPDIERWRGLPREQVLPVWKEKHAQHCLSYHLDPRGCARGRTCAFLHADVMCCIDGSSNNHFDEKNEVAG